MTRKSRRLLVARQNLARAAQYGPRSSAAARTKNHFGRRLSGALSRPFRNLRTPAAAKKPLRTLTNLDAADERDPSAQKTRTSSQ